MKQTFLGWVGQMHKVVNEWRFDGPCVLRRRNCVVRRIDGDDDQGVGNLGGERECGVLHAIRKQARIV